MQKRVYYIVAVWPCPFLWFTPRLAVFWEVIFGRSRQARDSNGAVKRDIIRGIVVTLGSMDSRGRSRCWSVSIIISCPEQCSIGFLTKFPRNPEWIQNPIESWLRRIDVQLVADEGYINWVANCYGVVTLQRLWWLFFHPLSSHNCYIS
jgi:hypothetical protein